MRDRIADFGDDTIVALVTFTQTADLASYEHDKQLGFAVLRDPEREGYRAFGFGRGRTTRVWGLRAARRYLELLRAGHWRALRRPTEDTRQLGGDVVIDADGVVRWIHHSQGPEDRPTVDALVDAVDRARSRLA
ncbi:MAG: hypothetical protein DHS20C19_07850 [Acidimicrobiales bacterium]|nr:MAG: hypothetical protein DHS20C19_07850 [Acidimicrobiales bacterium]